MEYKEFLDIFMLLQTYFGKTLQDSVIKIYWNSFKDYKPAKFQKAINNLMVNFHPTSTVPFPLISDIKEAVGEDGASKVKRLMANVFGAMAKHGAYQSVNFGCPELHDLINRYGGWAFLCRQDGEYWQYNQKRFENDLEAAINGGFGGSEKVVGLFEIDNAEKGRLDDIPKTIEYYVNEIEKMAYENKKQLS